MPDLKAFPGEKGKNPLQQATLWYYGRKTRAGDSEWTKRGFHKFEAIWERLRIKWPSYWVSLLNPYRVLSRDGETSLCILNDRRSSSWP
jgi:hypothetical protein